MKLTITMKKIKCGKEKCTMCPHDGFLYGNFTWFKKSNCVYIGKEFYLPLLFKKKNADKFRIIKLHE